jgi:hypothetical protein
MKEGRKKEKKRKMQAKPVSGNLFFSLPGKKNKRKRERVVRLRRSVSDALE